MTLNYEERAMAKQYAYNGADFMFIPSELLIQKIIHNHPQTIDINNQLKMFLLEGNALRLDPNLIIEYCDNEASKSNTWLLDQGDIKVEPARS